MDKEKPKKSGGKKKKPVYFVDYEFLIILIFLMCFGLIMLYSATASSDMFLKKGDGADIFKKQVAFTILGFAGMYVISKLDYHFYGRIAVFLYVLSLVLMFLVGAVSSGAGPASGGVERSLSILPGSGISFEPSEPAKVAVIIFAAYLICKVSKRLRNPKVFVMILLLSAFTGLWVKFFTTNLSTAIIIAAIPVLMLFVAHPSVKPFALLAFIIFVLAAGVINYALISTKEKAENQESKEDLISSEEGAGKKDDTKSYQFERIRSWVTGSDKGESKGTYQVRQGMYAIGSGGFWGKGLGESDQKLEAVPLVKNDMILAVICEELGIFGAALILALFGYLLFRLMFIAKNAPDMFGALIVIGVFIHIALQVILNFAVATNLIPTTGITLPFFSSGGSALLITLGEMGIVWGISRKIVLE